MTGFLVVLLRYVAPFLLGVSMAVAAVTGNTASIFALLLVAALWFFSTAARPAG